MKFTINKDEFTKSLLNVSRIVQPKATRPILTQIKLVLNSTGLNITGSNSDVTISETIPLFDKNKEIIRDVQQGSILVNAKMLTDIAQKYEGDEITFELLDESIIKIANNKNTTNLNSMPSEEYPDIDLELTGTHLVFDKDQFIECVHQVSFAASQKDTTRLLFACVNLRGEPGVITFTATDSARLAERKIICNNENVFNVNILSKTLLEVVKSLNDVKQVELYISDRKVLFNLGNTIITSKLVPGDYPNTKSLIPKSFLYYLEVDAEEFINAMDRISVLSAEKENVVKLIMTSDKCEISAKALNVGSAVENLDLFKYQGERLEISFNALFVSNAIRALKSKDVVLSFLGEMKPFTVTDKNNDNIVQLITPLRAY